MLTKINPQLVKITCLLFLALILTFQSYSLNVTISTNGSAGTICPGTQVTFTATISNLSPCQSGADPRYSSVSYYWSVNDNSVGGSGSTFTTSDLKNGDRVKCTVVAVYVNLTTSTPGPCDDNNNLTYTSNQVYMSVYNDQSDLVIYGPINPVANTTNNYSAPQNSVYKYLWNLSPASFGEIISNDNNGNISVRTSTTIQNGVLELSSYYYLCPPASAKKVQLALSSVNAPPTKPNNVMVSANTDNQSLTLSWDPSTDNLGVSAYKVYYKDISTQPEGTLAYVGIGGNSTSVNLTGLLEGHEYKYYVVAIDEDGATSAPSDFITYTIDKTPPSAPQNLKAIEQTSNSVTIAWTPSTDNVRTTGYDVYKDGVLIASSIATPFYISSLPTIPVAFYVKAKDAKGNISIQSESLNISEKVNPFKIDPETGNVGISVDPPSEKLDIDGNLKVRGNLISNPITVTGDANSNNRLTFHGNSLEIFAPSQAQYNGNKPIISMGKWGEINFNSTPILNYNSILLKGAGDYKSGLGHKNEFGNVGGINGPVLYGENGGALGSKQGSWNGPEQTALKWDNTSSVSVVGALFPKGGIRFNDGSLLNGSNGLLKNGQSDVFFSDKLQIKGTDPLLRIGSLVMQDVSSSVSSTSVVYFGSGSQLTTRVSMYPQAFVFGNMYYDAASGRYKSIYSIKDSVVVVQRNGGFETILTDYRTQNGGVAINFNAQGGSIEFVAVPSVVGTAGSGPWGVDADQIGDYKRMVINNDGNVDVNGVIKVNGIRLGNGPVITSLANGQWKNAQFPSPTTNLYYDLGSVGIGRTPPTGSIFFVQGNSKFEGNVDLAGTNPSLNIVNGGQIKFLDNGQISSFDNYHRILFRRNENKMEFREYGDIVFSSGATASNETAKATLRSDGVFLVKERIETKEYRMCMRPGECIPDWVFSKSNKLMSLEELKEYVYSKGHLPAIKSGSDMMENGVNLKELNMGMLQSIEELTLYVIELKEEIEKLKKR